ncbi:MAG: AAA family ATPase [Thermotoga sp. 4484_232]|nr:MoxR family ATPase [Thermotogaceae bacterium]OQX58266.1 MAG: AAA family ATPase [Thermotoga sp. 4484_232]RKX39011.1 MAG: MoxR family ATPase [Thermotogota bacterium]RKX55567.1 MAG: MoxR family ATPase [Thermotoga sp.]HDG61687.1 MoxR family ATPase [Thermotoga sp.]
MNVSEAKYLVRKIMEAGEVPLLIGHFGVGKTDIAREIANETGRRLIILILSQMEPGDLIGLPSRGEDRTIFLKPDWWPEDGRVIIFLDEINRAHRSIRNAIMQLIIDKRIHNHVLPEGTWIMAAMNPPDEEYDQADLITDPAFISRFFIIEVSPDPREWVEWAERMKVADEVIEFIRKYPEFLFSEYSMSLKTTLKPSPRSWYKLSNVLRILSEDERKKYGYILAAGIVGPEAAKAFYDTYLKGSQIPSVDTVLFNGDVNVPKDLHLINSLVLRIIDFFSKVDRSRIEGREKTIAKNLSKLSQHMPKESFYGILRFIVDASTKNDDKSDIFDNVLEYLSQDPEIEKFLRDIVK